MTDNRIRRLMGSVGLCLAGIIVLLFNSGLLDRFEPSAQYLLSALLLLGGFGFFGAYATARDSWWRLIPGWTLIALSAMSILSTIETIDERVNASLLFVGLASAFFHIYVSNRREHWWTIIPGGFMLVIGCVVGLSSFIERAETLGGILFVGMGAVFLLLYSVGRTNHRWWSLIPASILGIFGLFVFSLNGFGQEGEGAFFLRWWPILLIVIGLWIGFRSNRMPRQEDKIVVKSAPKSRYTITGSQSSKGDLAEGVPSRREAILARLKPKSLFPNRSVDPLPKTISREGPLPGTSIEILPEE